jgi:hypothetical protein
MNKKILLFGIGLILLIVIVSVFYLSKPKEGPYYSDKPSEWIVAVDVSTKEIDVNQVSKGQALDNNRDMYFYINGTTTSFEYEGYYKGKYFTRHFPGEEPFLIRINPEMKPADGVMEGYLVERFINDTYQVFIFLDNDWKQEIPDTNIVWGKDYVFARPFDFSNEISPGLYMDEILDDPRRFGWNHRVSYSAILVGDITQEEAKQGYVEDITAIVFQ